VKFPALIQISENLMSFLYILYEQFNIYSLKYINFDMRLGTGKEVCAGEIRQKYLGDREHAR